MSSRLMSSRLIALLAATVISGSVFAQAQPVPAPTAPVAPKPAVTAPAAPAAVAPKPVTPAATNNVVPMNQKVNLNTATDKELDTLPQIGAARSKLIVEARAKAKFKDWADFTARNVVPKNAEDAIKDKVRF